MQTNSELIQAVLADDDHEAFAALVLRFEKLVWTTAWQILGNYHVTQDVTQESFLAAHKHLHRLRDPDAVGSWLCQIARRQAIRARKSLRRMSATEQVDASYVAPTNPVSDEHQKLIDAIGTLPDHERVVVVLRFLNHHSVAEVAELSGRSVGTVTKQITRAIRRLRETLRRSEHSDAILSREAR